MAGAVFAHSRIGEGAAGVLLKEDEGNGGQYGEFGYAVPRDAGAAAVRAPCPQRGVAGAVLQRVGPPGDRGGPRRPRAGGDVPRRRRAVGAGDFLAEGEGSHNVSNSGDFSVEVLKRALEVWDLQFISMYSQAAAGSQSNHELETAFICHFQNHWFCIRNVDGEWYNFNSLYPAPEYLSQFLLAAYLDSMRGPGLNIYVVRGTFPRDCPTDYNDFGQWLHPEEARILTHSRFEAQQKQESNTAIVMASRRYLTVGLAAGLRGLEVPGTKTEVPRQQPYQQKGMSMMQEESDDDLKAAIAISLMPFEAPATSYQPAQEGRNLENALSKDTIMEEPGSSNSEGPVEED